MIRESFRNVAKSTKEEPDIILKPKITLPLEDKRRKTLITVERVESEKGSVSRSQS